MGMQDRLYDRLQSRPLPHDLGPARDLPAQPEGGLVRDPDLRKEAAGVEACQHCRIDHVGLDPRLGDEPHLAGICDHDPTDMGPDHFGDRARIAGRLDHDVVVVRQCFGKRRQVITRHPDPPQTPDRPVLQQHRLSKDAVDVQSHNSHEPASSCLDHGS